MAQSFDPRSAKMSLIRKSMHLEKIPSFPCSSVLCHSVFLSSLNVSECLSWQWNRKRTFLFGYHLHLKFSVKSICNNDTLWHWSRVWTDDGSREISLGRNSSEWRTKIRHCCILNTQRLTTNWRIWLFSEMPRVACNYIAMSLLEGPDLSRRCSQLL